MSVQRTENKVICLFCMVVCCVFKQWFTNKWGRSV